MDTHRQIVRRGARMVPALVQLLESEAVRNPGDATWATAKFGFAVDIMTMLGEIGDARPVPLLVRIIDGMDGKANRQVREAAVTTAAQLTYVSFDIDSDNPASGIAMAGDGAVVAWREQIRRREADSHLKTIARLYRSWLNVERDPSLWLAAAQARARKALHGSDEVMVRDALAFLAPRTWTPGHDDDPHDTLAAIVHLLGTRDVTLQAYVDRFISLERALASYGPIARPNVASLIASAKQSPTLERYQNLASVGGEAAVEHLVESLPKIWAEVDRLGLHADSDTYEFSNIDARQALGSYQACRWGVERWAGRTFANDQQVIEWWEQAKGRRQREWLEANLERTAAEADAGNRKAQHVLRQVLPDLPQPEADRQFTVPPGWHEISHYWERAPVAFRERWLTEHRARLTYDDSRSCFALAREK